MLALKDKYRDKVAFVIVDISSEEGNKLAQSYGVWGVPTTYIVKGDKVVMEKLGYATQKQLEQGIEEALK